MKINKRLNIVVPVELEDGTTVYVHAAPLPREIFEKYFMVISKTFASIYGQGLGSIAAPKVSGLILKQIATEMGEWEDVKVGLLAEIKRLCNVLVLTPAGWETVPLEEAIARNMFDEDDVADVDGVLIFFIVSSAMHRKDALRVSLDIASRLWNAQVTSSNCTEFATSLPTSTGTDSSGVKAIH